MTFYNTQVALEVRELAEAQLKSYIADVIKKTIKDVDYAQRMGISLEEPDIMPNIVENAFRKLPHLVNTLLYKDGVIFPKESPEDLYPVWLTYKFISDTEPGNEVKHLESFPKYLVGGMTTEGRIHT